jgi:hypothetical protein
MQDLIGKQLRQLYDSVLVEPIPDRIVELLMKLDDVPSDEDGGSSPSGQTAARPVDGHAFAGQPAGGTEGEGEAEHARVTEDGQAGTDDPGSNNLTERK